MIGIASTLPITYICLLYAPPPREPELFLKVAALVKRGTLVQVKRGKANVR